MTQIPFRLSRGRIALGLATLTLLAGGVAHAADPATGTGTNSVAGSDRTFIEKAAVGGLTEVEASKLAQSKGSSQAVKDYGAHMVTDHTKANEELKSIATTKGVTPPTTLDKSHQSDVDKLAKLSGADFDKAYIKQMVSDHKTTVLLFEKESKSGKDADLKAFASKTLPTLQEHLSTVQGMSASK